MSTRTFLALKKFILLVLIIGMGWLAVPLTSASAAGLTNTGTPPASPAASRPLAGIWGRERRIFQRQGERLARADDFIAIAQALINKANDKGWDTSLLQAALNAFQTATQDASKVHASGDAIVSTHAGFDDAGQVTDRARAIQTVQSLGAVIAQTRAAMNGTGRALLKAIRDFRSAHRPSQVPTTPIP